MSLPLSLEICTANKTHHFLKLCFPYIVVTILTRVALFIMQESLLSIVIKALNSLIIAVHLSTMKIQLIHT